jgi:ABC-type anion transport system duplicated permease subunit
MSFYLPVLKVEDDDFLETLVVAVVAAVVVVVAAVVVVEAGNVAGVALPHGTVLAAVTQSHIAPFLPHTQVGHGSCWALPCHG